LEGNVVMLTYKALLLDLDGLIVDSEPLHQRAYNLALLIKGIAFQFNVIEYGKSCVGRSVAELAHILTTTYPQLGSTDDFIRDRERIYEALIRDPDNLQPMPGLLQLPPGGQPILLAADAQTTGGYPILAVVIQADLPLAAHLLPGDAVRFALTTPAHALAALRQNQRWLADGLRECEGDALAALAR
jgi:hypothetical protein